MSLLVPCSTVPNRYVVYSLLGAGTYGVVVEAKDLKTLKYVAIKIQRESQDSENERITLFNINRYIIDTGICPFYPRMFGYFNCSRLIDMPPRIKTQIGLSNKIFDASANKEGLVMERADAGTAGSLMKTSPNSDEIRAFSFMIMYSLYCAWSILRFIHKDFQPLNVFFKKIIPEIVSGWQYVVGGNTYRVIYDSNIRPIVPIIGDFGPSALVERKDDFEKLEENTTAMWSRAPEFFFFPEDATSINYTHYSDMFSFGTIIAGMAYGKNPFIHYAEAKEYETLIYVVSADMVKMCRKYGRDTLFRALLCREKAEHIARYTIGLVVALGMPDPQNWPGIERSPILNSIKTNAQALNVQLGDVGKLWSDETIRSKLGAYGVGMLFTMLQWNSDNRLSAEQVLTQDLYFSPLQRPREDVEVIKTWQIGTTFRQRPTMPYVFGKEYLQPPSSNIPPLTTGSSPLQTPPGVTEGSSLEADESPLGPINPRPTKKRKTIACELCGISIDAEFAVTCEVCEDHTYCGYVCRDIDQPHHKENCVGN